MAQLRPLEAQEALNYLEKYLLGDDYYIVDPVNNMQGNAIIVDEIEMLGCGQEWVKFHWKEDHLRELIRLGNEDDIVNYVRGKLV